MIYINFCFNMKLHSTILSNTIHIHDLCSFLQVLHNPQVCKFNQGNPFLIGYLKPRILAFLSHSSAKVLTVDCY